ncbi:MAG: phytanoyl-CoA dioxygenase family protein [Flavobacteriales bacterium]|nr:phytanoyl-CoA dioxygenase family protein [Flavobacteriales bacterium]
MFDKEKFKHEIETQGYSIVRNALPPEFIKRAKISLEEAIQKETEYHNSNEYSDFGMVLLCSLYDEVFTDLFDLPLVTEPIETALGEGSIVYAYTSSSMPPETSNFSKRIHVDSPRIIPNYITNLGVTILLDDFTKENGATYFLPHSQTREEQPSAEEFYSKGLRLIEKAGSIWFFNARTWHAGGQNTTDQWRHALTLNMVRPWMKQRLDIPKAMAHKDLTLLSEKTKQKLGFYAQVPENYDEYYVPAEQRKFKQKVE